MRDKELQILERLDKVSLGIRGVITGADMAFPPIVLPAMAI